MSRGRPKKDTRPITVRLDVNILELLMSINPSLVTRKIDSTDLKFRHGALGRYIERLISEDLNERQKIIQENTSALAEDPTKSSLQAFLFSGREVPNNPNKDQVQ